MRGEEVREEEREVEDELLDVVVRLGIALGDVGVKRDHAVDGGHDHGEEDDDFLVVFRADLECGDLCEAFEGDVAEVDRFEELSEPCQQLLL